MFEIFEDGSMTCCNGTWHLYLTTVFRVIVTLSSYVFVPLGWLDLYVKSNTLKSSILTYHIQWFVFSMIQI